MKQHVTIGDHIQLDIKRMGINGEGIGYHDKLAVFVDDALPDETIKAEITEVYDNRAYAKLVQIIKENPERMTPFCPVYHLCGGCQTQHLAYHKSLDFKRDILLKAMNRYAGIRIPGFKVKQTLGATEPTHYRNKATLPIQKMDGKNQFGMYQKNSNIMIPIEGCPIQHEKINQIYRTIVRLMDFYGISGIDPKTKKGDMRHAVIRHTTHERQTSVSLIMTKEHPMIERFVKDLVLDEKDITSVFEYVQTNPRDTLFFSGKKRLLYGKEVIEESLNGQTFILKPEAFFQLNTNQADLFYQTMKRLAKLSKDDVAIDAYAGIAPVSHYICGDCKKVLAIESDEDSCESARLSLKTNGIDNVFVIESDFRHALKTLKDEKIDVMFFDPPRTGLGEETIDLILKYRPKKLIYGSCNPSTLAKDLGVLLRTYDLVEIVPIDMFPYTSLVESVTLLTLK